MGTNWEILIDMARNCESRERATVTQAALYEPRMDLTSLTSPISDRPGTGVLGFLQIVCGCCPSIMANNTGASLFPRIQEHVWIKSNRTSVESTRNGGCSQPPRTWGTPE
jgi:hypothetical protein